MPINPGKLDRRLTIQAKTLTRGGEGGFVESWTDLDEVWAQKLDTSGREFRTAQATHAEVNQLFRIRFYAGLTEGEHRVVYGTRTFDLIQIGEEGREEFNLLVCKYTEGRA